MELLNEYQNKAVQAHYWTSFSPDKRGEQLIKDYNEQLSEDVEELTNEGISEEIIESYKTRYKNLFTSWLNAKSRVASPMITGLSNFPTRRNEKANRSEANHYAIWQEWRLRAKKAICRKAKPEKTFLSEMDRYKNELEGCKRNHELMKQGNKRILAARKSGEDLTEYLTTTFNIPPHMIDWTLKFGFGLANNSANMRRLEERIKLMEAKESRSNEIGQNEFKFDGFVIVFNHEADRIQIKHDCKPPQEVINTLKSNCFRWSPSFMAWQRQLNRNGIYSAERAMNVKLTN